MRQQEAMSDPNLRSRWMAALALATPVELEGLWEALPDRPAYERLRGPEIGLVMVRGRAGGEGRAFNLGEMAVTRCAVRLTGGNGENGGRMGVGYLSGRKPGQAEQAAVLDAMLQDEARRPGLMERVILPLEAARARRAGTDAARVAATRVDFFTMVRGA